MPSKKNSPGKLSGYIKKIRKIAGLNIGTAIFAVLFIYMLFSAVLYLTSTHIESYQVAVGPLSRNETYTGLAVREEKNVRADSGGYVTYYAREGNKINANGVVYGLSATKTPETQTKLSSEELSRIRDDMMSFSKGFDPSKFNKTYSFKYQLEGNILQYAGVTVEETPASSDADDSDSSEDMQSSTVYNSTANTVTLGNQTLCKSDSDGIVLYSKDGYEGKTLENITAEDFDQNSYHETDLKTDKTVKAGTDIYTIITDERWDLLIPLSEKQAAKLTGRTSIRVKFLKDDMTQSGDFEIIEIDGGKYGRISFNKGLIRYASDRFLEIELVTNNISGLKIPLTSIVTKEFYTIPDKFATVNKDSLVTGFYLYQKNKDGETVKTFTTPTIYAQIAIKSEGTGLSDDEEEEYMYYVDKSAFQEGDAIVTEDSNVKFIVGDTDVLEGVYCINQGYAVFRRIEILDQNEEYAIVSKDTTFGLARYDHIVKNADEVKEQDILY